MAVEGVVVGAVVGSEVHALGVPTAVTFLNDEGDVLIGVVDKRLGELDGGPSLLIELDRAIEHQIGIRDGDPVVVTVESRLVRMHHEDVHGFAGLVPFRVVAETDGRDGSLLAYFGMRIDLLRQVVSIITVQGQVR